MKIVITSLIITFFSSIAWGEIYQWIDKDGNIRFSNVKKPKDAIVIKEIDYDSEKDKAREEASQEFNQKTEEEFKERQEEINDIKLKIRRHENYLFSLISYLKKAELKLKNANDELKEVRSGFYVNKDKERRTKNKCEKYRIEIEKYEGKIENRKANIRQLKKKMEEI